jgi:LmbE family N-acetylglucosaminyl deacetylase
MRRHLALLVLAAIPAAAQQIDDPANLMGERVSPPALADTLPINHGAPALEQLLRKLRTRASMMLIVAHPDDEDGGLLTLESRGAGARVAMLTLTRGEGGQNLMSADFNDALGLIRTQELLAEDRYTGTDQFFGTEVDFGFSKTKEESFQKWTHERVLYDAVRAVRLYRPLVLASVFIGGVTDGHGHHQVSGEICQEVFLAAADPKVFPEMGLPPWAPLKVYARVPFARITDQGMFDYATGKFSPPRFTNYVTGVVTTTEPQATVTIHEGDKPSIPAFNGMSYVQFARQGLALQKSQIGAGVRVPPAGRFDVGYTLMATRATCPAVASSASPLTWSGDVKFCPKPPTSEADLFDNIDTSIAGIASLAPDASPAIRNMLRTIDTKLDEAQRIFDQARPEVTVPALKEALRLLNDLLTSIVQLDLNATQKFNLLHEVRVKATQTDEALLLALGLVNESKAHVINASDGQPRPAITTISDSNVGDKIQVETTATSPLEGQLVFGSNGAVHLHSPKNPKAFQPNDHSNISAITPRGRAHETCPYFERSDARVPVYDVSVNALRNAPEKPPFFNTLRIGFNDVTLTSVAAVQNDGQPLRVVAPISVVMASHVGIFRPDSKAFPVEVSLSTDSPSDLKGALSLLLPTGWTTTPDSFSFAFHNGKAAVPSPIGNSDMSSFTFLVTPAQTTDNTSYNIKARARIGFTDFTKGYRQVGYPGLTYSDYCTPATYTATAVDVTTAPHLHIAYLPGTGDEVPQFLPSLGITPTILKPSDLTKENLKQYDAILLGVRAYAAHPELSGSGSDPLNDYAKQGGIVIAQYNSGGFNPASAPFPYTLPGDSAHNVVDETDKVTLLAPESPLLTWPNRITSADFNSWVEERGHGFASDWSPEYQPLLEMHDPEQDPQKGGLLLAKVGKGAYIYCALALYRQLPEGVPGAYRLIANLLSYAKNPGR